MEYTHTYAYSYRVFWCGKVIAHLTGNTQNLIQIRDHTHSIFICVLYVMWYSYTIHVFYFHFYDYSKWIITANNQHKNPHNTIAWKEMQQWICCVAYVRRNANSRTNEWTREYVDWRESPNTCLNLFSFSVTTVSLRLDFRVGLGCQTFFGVYSSAAFPDSPIFSLLNFSGK